MRTRGKRGKIIMTMTMMGDQKSRDSWDQELKRWYPAITSIRRDGIYWIIDIPIEEIPRLVKRLQRGDEPHGMHSAFLASEDGLWQIFEGKAKKAFDEIMMSTPLVQLFNLSSPKEIVGNLPKRSTPAL